jgi:hypothetical protein
MSKKSAPTIHSRINLNLLYPQGVPQKIYIKFLKWLISYGRFIVVGVEIIVLACFGMRFKLDADLADLKEKINSQVPYLESLVVDEAVIKQTHLRLATAQSTYNLSPSWLKTLNEISSLTPLDVKLTTLTIEKNPTLPTLAFKISAQTPSHNMLSVFLVGLRESKAFKDVGLSNISYDDGEITFTITGSTK